MIFGKSDKRKCLFCKRNLKEKQEKYCSRECRFKKERKDRLRNKLKGKKLLKKLLIILDHYNLEMHNLNSYLYLFSWILMAGLFIYLYFTFFNNKLTTLGFNLTNLFNNFAFVTYFFGMFLLFKYVIIFFQKYKKKRLYSFLKNKANNYVILAFYFICLLLLVGADIIQIEYKTELPKPFKIYYDKHNEDWINQNIEEIRKNYCESVNKYIDFVREDKLKCTVEINYSTDTKFMLSQIEVQENLFNGEHKKQELFSFKMYSDSYDYYINFGDSAYQSYSIYFRFENSSGYRIPVYHWDLENTFITEEDYAELQKQKLPLFLALISISIFSVIAAFRNLKELIEKKY